MELKQFDYTKRPYTSSKVYDVFPLSREGFSQYIGNDSYTHKFIKTKFDSKTIEKLYGTQATMENSNQHLNQNFSHNNCNNFKKETIDNKNFIENEKTIAYSPIKEEYDFKKIESLKNNLIPKNDNSYLNKTSKNFYTKNNDLKNTFANTITNNFQESGFKNKQFKDEIGNFKNNNLKEFHSDKKSNCYSSYINHSKKTDDSKTQSKKDNNKNSNKSNLNKFLYLRTNINKKNNPRENIRFDTNYASDIEFIKKNQNLFFDFSPKEDNYEFKRKKKYEGFESFNIPRIENSQKDLSKPSFQYTQRIVKSCYGRRKEKNKNSPITKDLVLNNNKDQIENDKITNKIKEENERLKKILNNQTNKDFLMKGNMPKISYVALQPKLIIKKFGLGGEGKYFGGKYNPDNFQTGRGDDRNRRNYVGGLYLN